jgi:hypothetical protein
MSVEKMIPVQAHRHFSVETYSMRYPWRTATVLVVAFLLSVTGSRGADKVPRVLYGSNGIGFMITLDAKIRKDLNITKEQLAAVEKVFAKQRQREGGDADKIFKMKGPDKDAKIRALYQSRGEEFLQTLGQALRPDQIKRLKQIIHQQCGITLLDYPEIQSALGMSQDQATKLTAMYEQVKLDMQKDFIAQMREKKITREEANDRLNALAKGIPDPIRAKMTREQRVILADLLGPPYAFPK